jgi:uncharacterized protein (TIGR02147 family)
MEYIRQLEQHFEVRKSQNSSYSLRAYARDLGLEPSTLSKVLKGQRGLPFAVLETVAIRLKLNMAEKEQFFSSVLQKRGYGKTEALAWPMLAIKFLKSDLHFRIISEWEYYAFLNLIKLKDFKSKPNWISDRLGISLARCKTVIDGLLKAEMIKKNENDEFVRCYPRISSSDNLSSSALKLAHQNDLKLAASKIWNTSVEERDFYSMIMPINVKNLKKAKLLTRNYTKQLEKLMESGDLTEVYQLAIQFFPLTTTFKKKLRGYQ